MRKLFVPLTFTLLSNYLTFAQNSSDVNFIKNKHIKYLTPRLDGRTARINVLFGDLNGDGVKDAFIEWCIQANDEDRDAGGGNALMSLECIEEGFSVYIKEGNEYVLKADKGKEYFTEEGITYEADKIEKGKVICSNMSYSDDDPRCCPSIKRTIYLIYKNNKIIQLDQNPKVIRNPK